MTRDEFRVKFDQFFKEEETNRQALRDEFVENLKNPEVLDALYNEILDNLKEYKFLREFLKDINPVGYIFISKENRKLLEAFGFDNVDKRCIYNGSAICNKALKDLMSDLLKKDICNISIESDGIKMFAAF